MSRQYVATEKPYGYFSGKEYWLARIRDFICPMAPIVQKIPERSTHLDIGCGRGVLLGVVTAERGTLSSGCEVSAAAVAAARCSLQRLASRLGCRAPNVVHTPSSHLWPPGPFDVVTIVDVLHHVAPTQQEVFLTAAARRVRNGGMLIFKDMALYPIWKRMMNTLHDLLFARQLVHYMSLDAVIALLRKEGLVLAETERYNALWYSHELAVLRRPR
jgi:2-polyprenyl-3-methyl-5-hydroxy-6-metoxy-1,4-benzoquinol methylase